MNIIDYNINIFKIFSGGVFILHNRKHRLPATFFILCIIGLLGFKDTGIFVKDYLGANGENQPIKFVKEEKIDIIKETKNDYIVSKENLIYEIPKDAMIRTTYSGQKYKVLEENTEITDKPYGSKIGILNLGEEVQALNLDQEYGLFQRADGVKGYIELKNIEKIIEKSISHGISKVNKVIKVDNLIYTLIKGEVVAIKDFKNNSYLVVDEDGNEFSVDENYIEIRRNRERPTRGSVSTSPRARDISKVVSGAYEALGTKYVYAGTSKNGYDCSGLSYGIFKDKLGINLPRSSTAQSQAGKTVAKSDLIPGDLIFFKTTSAPVGHVGIYIGDNLMIHASTGQRKVIITDINSAYYKARYVNSKRIIE